MSQGKTIKVQTMHHMFDGELEAVEINGQMCIMTHEFPIFVTREQAKEFFGFKDE